MPRLPATPSVGEVLGSSTFGHFQVSPSPQRLAEHEQIASPITLVLVVISLRLSRLCRDARALVRCQLLGGLVEADHRSIGIVGFLVQVQHIFHAGDELPAYLWNTPFLSGPWFEFVFFSICRTVSREMASANSISTTLLASNCRVQWLCPSGAWLQAIATMWASCFPSNFRFCPGRARSLRALSTPSSTNRLRIRPTVEVLTSNPLATSWSASPSSAFNKTSARFTLRADDLPRRATSRRYERCESANSTLYLMTGMSLYVLLQDHTKD